MTLEHAAFLKEKAQQAVEVKFETTADLNAAWRIVRQVWLEGPRGYGDDNNDLYDIACRRCGQQIIQLKDGTWTHFDADEDGSWSRGCRAASFVSGQGWNENLPSRWKAAR